MFNQLTAIYSTINLWFNDRVSWLDRISPYNIKKIQGSNFYTKNYLANVL